MRSFAREWSVKQLIDRCSKRPVEEIAWQEFVRRFHPTIRAAVSSVFVRLTENENGQALEMIDEVVDQLAHDVYGRLIENGAASLRRVRAVGDGSIKKYLLLVSINVVRDHLRHGVKRVEERAKPQSRRLDSAFGLTPTRSTL